MITKACSKLHSPAPSQRDLLVIQLQRHCAQFAPGTSALDGKRDSRLH